MTALDGGKAQAEIEMAKKLEEEREKRVEHLAKVGIRRMFQHGLAKGWTTWHDSYLEKARQKRLLKASAGRLMKPRLAAAVTHWLRDWAAETAAAEAAEAAERANSAYAKQQAAVLEVEALRAELAEARQAMASGNGKEVELQKQYEEQLEAEREKRVRHLQQAGLKTLCALALGRSFQTWLDQYLHRQHQLRLIGQVMARLGKPKLSMAVWHWKHDFEGVVRAKSTQKLKTKFNKERTEKEQLEEELIRVKNELQEKLMLQSVALVEARSAAASHQEEMIQAVQAAAIQKEALAAAKEALEEREEDARRAKRQLKLEQEKQSVGSEQLAKMLAEQRSQLEKESKAVRVALEEQAQDAIRKAQQAKADAAAAIEEARAQGYDGSRVAQHVFHPEEGTSRSPAAIQKVPQQKPIDEAEKRKKLKNLGPVAQVVSQVANNATGSLDRVLDLDDDPGNEKGEDFFARMKKRAEDYYNADKDGDNQLDFDEFCEMVDARDDHKEFPSRCAEHSLIRSIRTARVRST